jgi:hypothetical protein
MKNSEQAAFPLVYDGPNANSFCHDGLTKREYFAAMAMQGLLSADARYNNRTDDRKSLAKDAIAFADELLKQLDNQEKQ